MHRPPGQLAVADLAPARAADPPRLAHGERREIVVQHERLAVFADQRVDDLLVLAGAQRGHHQRLGLAAGEQGRTVRPVQDPDFGDDRPDRLGVAAVDARPGIQDLAADDIALHVVEGAGCQGQFGCVFADRGDSPCAHRVDGGVALLLDGDLVGLAQFAGERRQLGLDRFQGRRRLRQVPGLLGAHFREIDDRVDHRLHALMAEGDGAQHDVFAQLLGFRLDHQHAFLGAGDDQVQSAVAHLLHQRVQDVLAVDVGHPGGAHRAEERHAGDGQRRRGRHQGDDVGVVFQVMAQNGADDLHFVLEIVMEQRPDRPVDQAAGQRLTLAGPAFALEKTAGDLTGGERLFLVVHGQWEEVLARLWRSQADRGGHDDGAAIGGDHRTVGLAGDLAGFQDQAASAPFNFLAIYVEHSVNPYSAPRPVPLGSGGDARSCSSSDAVSPGTGRPTRPDTRWPVQGQRRRPSRCTICW